MIMCLISSWAWCLGDRSSNKVTPMRVVPYICAKGTTYLAQESSV